MNLQWFTMPDNDKNPNFHIDWESGDETVSNISYDRNSKFNNAPELSENQKQEYKNRYGNTSFLKRSKKWFRNTWNGNNKEGKYLGLGLDVGESFLPDIVSRIRDITQNKTQPKTDTDMSYPKEKLFDKIKRFIKQKSTQTAIVSLLAIVGLVFGIDVNPQVFTETLLGIVTGVSAIVASVYNIYQMFQDEDANK